MWFSRIEGGQSGHSYTEFDHTSWRLNVKWYLGINYKISLFCPFLNQYLVFCTHTVAQRWQRVHVLDGAVYFNILIWCNIKQCAWGWFEKRESEQEIKNRFSVWTDSLKTKTNGSGLDDLFSLVRLLLPAVSVWHGLQVYVGTWLD